eukprot:1148112-Pelagomonas_calceolata.AAC.3
MLAHVLQESHAALHPKEEAPNTQQTQLLFPGQKEPMQETLLPWCLGQQREAQQCEYAKEQDVEQPPRAKNEDREAGSIEQVTNVSSEGAARKPPQKKFWSTVATSSCIATMQYNFATAT